MSDRVKLMTRATPWRPINEFSIRFNPWHPQGMGKIDGIYHVTSVEIKKPTKRLPAPIGQYDRDTGEGAGHLLRFSENGDLLADAPLGEGPIYHPGGIDYDGNHICVPVAE